MKKNTTKLLLLFLFTYQIHAQVILPRASHLFSLDIAEIIDDATGRKGLSFGVFTEDGYENGCQSFTGKGESMSLIPFEPISFTINFWFKTNDTNRLQRIFHRGGTGGSASNNFNYSLLYNGPEKSLRFNIGDPFALNNPAIFINNLEDSLADWNMITCSFNSSNTVMKIYLNGVLKQELRARTQYAKLGSTSAAPLMFSRYIASSPQSVDGKVDEILLWDSALTDEQVTSLFNQQTLSIREFKDISELGIQLYPNPVINNLTIQHEDLNINQIDVLDINSKVVASILDPLNGQPIDLKNLASGIYFIILDTEKGKASYRIIKK